MTTCAKLNEQECGFVEVLVTEREGVPFGYRFRGHRPGPHLVVAGMCPAAELTYDRVLQIPTLPWMRGTLTLIMLNALDDLHANLDQFDPLGPIDQTFVLPSISDGSATEFDVRRQYHAVLRACANLGMISGRGVAYQNGIGVAS